MAHERHEKRSVKRVHKCGYDLHSTRDGQERHIEVKATAKSHFTSRWLEELEWNRAQNDPQFSLYLVVDVDSKPRVKVFSANKLRKHFSRVEHHYIYEFRKSDFV